jgi:hypothetical protein
MKNIFMISGEHYNVFQVVFFPYLSISLCKMQFAFAMSSAVSVTLFRVVFWDILPCKIPEDNSEHHTRRRENLKSHIVSVTFDKVRRLE